MSLVPSKVRANKQDLQAFNILRQKTMGQIAGIFDRAFWTVDVLRASHVYPAIWHACLAISAMHERLQLPVWTSTDKETLHSRYEFALGQYNTAIQHLVKIAAKPRLTDNDQETIVLASILFTGICCMEGDLTQAITHARNGLGVFYQWQGSRPFGLRGDYRTGRVMSADALTTLTAHVSLQVFDRTCVVNNPPPHIPPELFQCAMTPFTSANAAYLELVPIASTLLEISSGRHVPGSQFPDREAPAIQRLRASYLEAFSTWETKFHDFLAIHDPTDDLHSVLLLRLLRTGLTLYTYEQNNETPGLTRKQFEKFTPVFERFVGLAEQVFEVNERLESDAPPVFSFSLAVLKFIFYVGRVCRDTELRKRLIAVLRANPRRDGVWDSWMLALVLEEVVQFEEQNAAAAASTGSTCECDVGLFACDYHRAASITAEYPADGVADVVLLTRKDLEEDTVGKFVQLVWDGDWERRRTGKGQA